MLGSAVPSHGARKRRASPPSPRPEAQALRPFRHFEWAVAALLCAATLVVYHPVLGHAFVNYDDDLYITRNAALRLGLSLDGLRWAFTSTHGANWFPLTRLSWLADYEMFGLSAPAFLATNVLLHLAAMVTLFLVLVRLTGALGRSAFVAAVFALHPLHVESVAWASTRKDVLSGVLFMVALTAYAAYARAPSPLRYLAVAAAFLLGLMAKPILVTLPFVLLLLDLWPLRRLQDTAGRLDAPRVRRAVVEKVPLLVLAAASCAVTFLVQRAGGAVEAGEVFSLRARVTNALVSYVVYLRLAVWPQGLAVFYPHPGDAVPLAAGLGALAVLAIATVALLRSWRARPEVAVGWLWYLGTLVPAIGLVQVGQQARADRYTYLPLVGVALVGAWGLGGPLARVGRHVPLVVGGAALVTLAVVAAAQVRVWRNSQALFAHALSVTGENAVARLNLGLALLDEGRMGEAEGHLREAVRLHPGSAEGHGALAEALARQGRRDAARAEFTTALRLDPSLSRVHNGYGRFLAEQGEAGPALLHLREAIALDPAYAEPYNNLGAIRLRQDAVTEAIDYFRKAVALDPSYAEAHANWARALVARGEDREAAERFRVAASLRPPEAESLTSWGLALARTRNFEGATARFRDAVALRPDDGVAQAGLALALAHQGQLAEALPHFERAAALRPQDAEALTSWGMALSGLGRTEEALARYRAALDAEPAYADAHNALGIALGNLGRLEEAAAHFRQAVARRPDMAPAWNNWGLVLARQERLPEAIARFREAVARDPAYADAHNNLGVFLAQRGRLEEAAAAFEHALRADPDHSGARTNLEKLAARASTR
jgi:type IV pilus biogenesis/stability protein PilW